jgi:NAD+ synthase
VTDYGQLAGAIATWLAEYAARAGAKGYVVGLSGGIDSATTAALCLKAVGKETVGVLMPCHSQPEDARMAKFVAAALGLATVTVDLGPVFDLFVEELPVPVSGLAQANIKPRLRMACLYALAQAKGCLVAGTGNKSELLVGYFTKYGDGGVDVEPLGALYKWQVRELAQVLGVPQSIIDRPPSAGLWAGQTDEDEMGITYETLDRVLAALEAGQTQGIEKAVLDKVRAMIKSSEHKRAMPPVWRGEV